MGKDEITGKKIYTTVFNVCDPSLDKKDPNYCKEYEIKSYDDIIKLCPRGSAVKLLVEASRCWSPKDVEVIKSTYHLL